EAGADRIDDLREHDRHGARRLQQRRHDRDATSSQNYIGCERNQFRRLFANALGIAHGPAIFDARVAAVGPTKLLQALRESGEPGLTFRIIGGEIHEHADAPHRLALLRARRERPRCRRAAEQRDEGAPPHSITSSARARSVGGTSKPKALAVFRLTTNSNLVPCCTGRSAGFAPLRILSTKLAQRDPLSLRLAG